MQRRGGTPAPTKNASLQIWVRVVRINFEDFGRYVFSDTAKTFLLRGMLPMLSALCFLRFLRQIFFCWQVFDNTLPNRLLIIFQFISVHDTMENFLGSFSKVCFILCFHFVLYLFSNYGTLQILVSVVLTNLNQTVVSIFLTNFGFHLASKSVFFLAQ